MSRRLLSLILLGALLLAFFLSVRFGHVSLTTEEAFQAFLGSGNPTHRRILLEIRLRDPTGKANLLLSSGAFLPGGGI